MPIHLTDENDGIVVIQVTGTLQKTDYPPFVSEFEQLVRKRKRKLRLLFDMSELKSWSPSAVWPELKFDTQHLSQIERLAAVGNKEWERRVTELTKPFTSATMRYFDIADANAAREWLRET